MPCMSRECRWTSAAASHVTNAREVATQWSVAGHVLAEKRLVARQQYSGELCTLTMAPI